MDLKIILFTIKIIIQFSKIFRFVGIYLTFVDISAKLFFLIDKNSHIHKNTHTFINIHVRNKFYNHHKNKSLVKINIKSYELNEMNDKTNSCDTKRR